MPRRSATAIEALVFGLNQADQRDSRPSGMKAKSTRPLCAPRSHSPGPRTHGGASSRFRGPAIPRVASSRPGRPASRFVRSSTAQRPKPRSCQCPSTSAMFRQASARRERIAVAQIAHHLGIAAHLGVGIEVRLAEHPQEQAVRSQALHGAIPQPVSCLDRDAHPSRPIRRSRAGLS